MIQPQEKNKHATLFKDLTTPLSGVRTAFAEDPAMGDEESPDAGAPEESILIHRSSGEKASVPASAIHAFTVGKKAALSSTEVHRFRQQNELLMRSLAARLSLFLRTEFGMDQSSLEILDLPKYAKEYPAKRHIILFRIHPLDAVGAFDVSKHLGLTMADRMLGGKGFAVNPDRMIREVESAMIDQVAQLTLREWAKNWKFEEPLRITLLGHEEDPLHIPCTGEDETFYHISINADIGDCMDQIQMLLPVRGVEPLLRNLTQQTSSEVDVEEDEEHEHWTAHIEWNDAYSNVNVPVTAEWSDLSIMAKDLLNLKKGDIIPLDPKRLGQVEVNLAGNTKFIGRLGGLENKAAVQVNKYFKD